MIEDAPPNSIMFTGLAMDTPEGLHMSGSGNPLKFVVFRGGIADWCIYCGLASKPTQQIRYFGNKPHGRKIISNVVEFDDEVWEMYRH